MLSTTSTGAPSRSSARRQTPLTSSAAERPVAARRSVRMSAPECTSCQVPRGVPSTANSERSIRSRFSVRESTPSSAPSEDVAITRSPRDGRGRALRRTTTSPAPSRTAARSSRLATSRSAPAKVGRQPGVRSSWPVRGSCERHGRLVGQRSVLQTATSPSVRDRRRPVAGRAQRRAAADDRGAVVADRVHLRADARAAAQEAEAAARREDRAALRAGRSR